MTDNSLIAFKPLATGRQVPEPPFRGLDNFGLEIDYSNGWVDLNDQLNFKVGAETMTSAQTTWRKVTVESPVTEGSYVAHAVQGMVNEQIQIYVYGGTQQEKEENRARLEYLFSRLDFRIRLTFDNYREYWRCQTSDWQTTRSQVFTHNMMSIFDATVPRFPTVTREILG
jgi:hypothetical protein